VEFGYIRWMKDKWNRAGNLRLASGGAAFWVAAVLLMSVAAKAGQEQAPKSPVKASPTAKAANKATKMSAAPKENIKRLQPSDIAALPKDFVEKLNARGCTIPQFDYNQNAETNAAEAAAQPTNVIEGEFAKKGQKDWAVLCSNGKTSTIVIYWSKATACPASLARLDDAHYLKAWSKKDKTLHYSRSIRPLGEAELGERAGMSALRPLQHQGIDDRFVGKSSAFFYCDAGKWRIFPAKDAGGTTDSPADKKENPAASKPTQ
jgi:hypothetical protein